MFMNSHISCSILVLRFAQACTCYKLGQWMNNAPLEAKNNFKDLRNYWLCCAIFLLLKLVSISTLRKLECWY